MLKAVQKEARDPSSRAAATQAAGAGMIVDGLVGLENPLDGKKTRVGIGGALIGIVMGLVFVVIGFVIKGGTDPHEGGVTVSGVVVDVAESRGTNNRTTYAPVVEYVDPSTGQTYRATPSVYTSSRPSIGSEREVSFLPSDPAGGRVISTTSTLIPWMMIGLGGLLTLASAGTFLVRLLTIVAGGALLVGGMRRRKALGDERGVVETLVDAADDVIEDVRGSSATQAGPPAGWYQDPSDPQSGHLRWWDGSTWTDHVRTAEH